MTQSMTGFAHTTTLITAQSGDRSSVSLSLKTLNSRFFEATIKLPTQLTHLETRCLKLFKQHFKRGHIYFTLQLSNSAIFEGALVPSLATIDNYLSAFNEIKQRGSFTQNISIDTLARLPNIFSKEEKIVDEDTTEQLFAVVSDLIEKVIEDRCAEGTTIEQDFYTRMSIIKKEMVSITNRAHAFLEEWKNKVHATLQEIGADDNLIVNAQKNALYSILDKIDIHEEINRLNAHLESLLSFFSTQDIEKGKRIDFTLQELGREINTIASKCSDSILSAHAINVKVEIEKMREQAQNLV